MGITGDCALDGSITLVAGDNKSCMITNRDIQSELKVIKHVINDNCGSLVAGNFTLNVAGTSPSPASFPGVEAPGTTVTLNVGTYAVSESVPAGYSATYSSNCSGTIDVGHVLTYTVTNDDIAPALHLRKMVINDNGGTALAAD